MKDVNELNLEIEKIHSDIRLIEQTISSIKNNHLFHIQRDVDRINKVLWAIGFGVFTQFIIVIRDFIIT
jgi:prefoldin subunit 5